MENPKKQGKQYNNASNTTSSNKKKSLLIQENHHHHHKERKEIPWWKRLNKELVDPISHEPIYKLRYPPYSLEYNGATEAEDKIIHYFDGQMLAKYVTSTGNFMNPNNRVELTRADCLKLDNYLLENRLHRFKVAEAFASKELVQNASSRPGARAAENQTGASVLMHTMFNFPAFEPRLSSRSLTPPQQQQQQQQQQVQSGGLRVVDEDAWETQLFDSEGDFPSIAPPSRQMATTTTSTWRTRLQPNGSLPDAQDFPTLNSSSSSTEKKNITTRSIKQPRDFSVLKDPEPTRPKLALKPRSLPLSSLSSSSSASSSSSSVPKVQDSGETTSSSLFGNAKPREVTLASRGVNITEAEIEHEMKAKVVKLSMSKNPEYVLNTLYCPYFPSFLETARSFGIQYVSHLESTLRAFIVSTPSNKTLTPEMVSAHPAGVNFIRELCTKYWGLDVNILDNGRHVQIFKTATSLIPDITITQALGDFPEYSSQAMASPEKGQPSYIAGVAILLLGLRGPGGTIPSNDAVLNALSDMLRPSEVNFSFIGDEENLYCDLSLNPVRARKLYLKLRGNNGHLGAGGIKFSFVQWWPVGKSFAERQYRDRVRLVKDAIMLQREERKHEAEEQEKLQATLGKTRTAWSDDDEDNDDNNNNDNNNNDEKEEDFLPSSSFGLKSNKKKKNHGNNINQRFAALDIEDDDE